MKISIYNIKDEPIGRGGMGQVYLATDPNGNLVAVKEMLAQYVSDEGLRKRFHQEVNILKQLEHPAVVKMYASFEERGNLYLVMEYVNGVTVDEYVRRHGALSEKESLRIISELLSALQLVHSRGYVHRDIKPGNIMIRPDGSVFLLDFGIAKDMNRAGSGQTSYTTVGATIGTVGYMSPEQAEGNSIDWRSDIYSLGCVLFYMLTGQHAYKEESNEIKTRLAVINNPFPSVKLCNPGISDRIQFILSRATDKNMKMRFQSCQEFADQINYYAKNQQPETSPETDPKKQKQNTPNRIVIHGWRKNIIIASIASVCAITAFIVWLFLPDIQYSLGKKNYKNERYIEALQYFHKAADRGNVAAKNKLGECYSKGNGTVKDAEQAVFWWRNAAEQGNTEAKYNLGECYYSGNGAPKDYEKAVYWFRDAAELGYDNAQFWLGRCYNKGEGIKQDREEAMKWYLKAAEHGHAKAHYNIGILYTEHPYLNKEEANNWYKKAVELYTELAEQGNAEFQWRLGKCYHNGIGIDLDYKEAVKWYRKAAKQNDAYAQYWLGICYDAGNGVTQDFVQAAGWHSKAAEQGQADAQYMLGIHYEHGEGVIKDAAQAVIWYLKAAEQQVAGAQCNMGKCCENGDGVTKDAVQAVNWYLKAAEQQFAEAQYRMGKCYDNGIGVKKDYEQSAIWYSKAAAQGHTPSQLELGICYTGFGIKKDGNTALYWFEKAAQNEDGELSEYGADLAKKYIKNLKDAGYSCLRAQLN